VGQGQLLISFRIEAKKTPSPFLAPQLGLSLAKAASATWQSTDWSLKVPNDLFLGNTKVAGLLVEAIQQGPNTLVIVGLGMNISAKPAVALAGALTDHLSSARVPLASVCDFLERFQLELNIAFAQTEDGLSATDLHFLEFFVQKNPVTPRVKTILVDGTLVYDDGQTKKWMDL
jgi:BirA family biotin operon repressor/biotin-[acetyl-CoA-carboxylase] ligase